MFFMKTVSYKRLLIAVTFSSLQNYFSAKILCVNKKSNFDTLDKFFEFCPIVSLKNAAPSVQNFLMILEKPSRL